LAKHQQKLEYDAARWSGKRERIDYLV